MVRRGRRRKPKKGVAFRLLVLGGLLIVVVVMLLLLERARVVDLDPARRSVGNLLPGRGVDGDQSLGRGAVAGGWQEDVRLLPIIERISLFDQAGELHLVFTARHRRVSFFYDLYRDGDLVEVAVNFHDLALPIGASFAGLMSLSCNALASMEDIDTNIELMIDIRANISVSQIYKTLLIPDDRLHSIDVMAFEIHDFLAVRDDQPNYLWWVRFGGDERIDTGVNPAVGAAQSSGDNYLIYMAWALPH